MPNRNGKPTSGSDEEIEVKGEPVEGSGDTRSQGSGDTRVQGSGDTRASGDSDSPDA